MQRTKEELINFLDTEVLSPVENHPRATDKIKKKVRTTRMRLNKLVSAEKVEQYFWNSMVSDRGIDSYTRITEIGAKTFEDVRFEFKKLCGQNK